MDEDPQIFRVCGIDPGLTGAIAHLAVNRERGACWIESVHDMPTAQVKIGKSEKSQLILSEIKPLVGGLFYRPDHVVIEEVGAAPGQGVTSMFRFGYVAGALAGVTAALDLPMTTIRPQRWMQLAGVRSGDDAGRIHVAQLFPKQSHFFARKKDHNRADAVLIAYAYACECTGQRLRTQG